MNKDFIPFNICLSIIESYTLKSGPRVGLFFLFDQIMGY